MGKNNGIAPPVRARVEALLRVRCAWEF